MTSEQLKSIERQALDADMAYRAIKREQDAEYEARRYAMEKEVNALFQERLNAAFTVKKDADTALDLARIEFNMQGGGMFSPGTILVKWRWGSYNGADKGKCVITDEKAIIEVYRPGDPFIGRKWNRPKVGDLIYRILKKDGRPGKKTKLVRCDMAYSGWYVAGVNPNELKEV